MSGDFIKIIRRADNGDVDAKLLAGLRPRDLTLIERMWGPVRRRILQELLGRGVTDRNKHPQSLHWDWREKGPALSQLACTGFGLEFEGQWQGALLTTAGPTHVCRIPEQKGMPLVYVDYIESAPWNWSIAEIGQIGKYGGVGSVLMHVAVAQSYEEEFKGRVGLHALPQAAKFYRDTCGMLPLGRDPNKENLLYFELDTDGAARFNKDGGTK